MTTVPLTSLARVIRSKNAGPLQVTVDVMFEDAASYDRAVASSELRVAAIARRYGVSENTVRVIDYRPALAVKIVFDRPVIAGTPGDRDVYGAQQHGPLLEVMI